MKTQFRYLFTSAGLVALLSIALLGSSTAAFADQNGPSREPEGSWLYTVTIPDFGSFQGVETYSAGGGYSEADQLSFSQGAVASAGHGAWKSRGKRKRICEHPQIGTPSAAETRKMRSRGFPY